VSLLAGLNHVAILTADLERFIGFYASIFEVEVVFQEHVPFHHAILRVGADSWLHPIETLGNPHATAIPRTFERGHLDHIALTAASSASFNELRTRLIGCGASDGVVDDLGAFHTLSFEDPDGMRGELTLVIDSALVGIHEPRPLGASLTAIRHSQDRPPMAVDEREMVETLR
jgi:catechol 2,3-dioxygenase-like lactoylglutathione lyase family enzyme